MTVFDLSAFSFEEFVAYFFAREVIADNEYDLFSRNSSGEYYEGSERSRPGVIIEHMTRLFSEFGKIAPKYSLPQINQGIWGILGEPLRLYEALWEESIDSDKRIACIRSMYFVYSDFVSQSNVEVMENCFDMWWDLLAYGFWFQTKLFERRIEMGDTSKLDPESRRLLDVMFETLTRILDLPDLRTQSYALHGLGHLHHPDVRSEVQRYIDSHKSEWTQEGLAWLERCRDSTVM